LPKEVIVNDGQIREAMQRTINQIIENIKITLETTPPELVADIYEHGIVLTGGGALLRGIDKEIAQAAKIPVRVADDPLTCMVRGASILLSDPELLAKVMSGGTDNF
ncbi:rod shape-determining protein, partial [Patescibacteria group bacterium]|nr:rod shape-determining protein [Patescibacteria group bacterium]MCG2698399.1 rod shape-determining protein [Candidatus Parcubacteria bacterium]